MQMIKAWQKLHQNPTLLTSNKVLQLMWCVQEQIRNRGHINAVCEGEVGPSRAHVQHELQQSCPSLEVAGGR